MANAIQNIFQVPIITGQDFGFDWETPAPYFAAQVVWIPYDAIANLVDNVGKFPPGTTITFDGSTYDIAASNLRRYKNRVLFLECSLQLVER